jgi:hypothetical protein
LKLRKKNKEIVMKKKQRILCLILSLMMLFTIVLPIGSFADEFDAQDEYVDDQVVEEADAYDENAYSDNADSGDADTEDVIIEEDTRDVIVEEDTGDNGNAAEAAGFAEEENTEMVAASTPVIKTEPKDVTVEVGETATFTVVAEGDGLSYQWYVLKPGATTWQAISAASAKTASYSLVTRAVHNGYKYKVEVTNSAGKTPSQEVTLTIQTAVIIEGVQYEKLSDTTCKVVSYSGSASALTIPETVEGMTVTEIGEEAFMNNTSLTSIDLPDSITVIRARAFKGCTNLSSMS